MDVSAPDTGPPAPCDLQRNFGTPTPLSELNTSANEAVSDVSADELTVYLASDHGGQGAQLFYATRTKRTDPFSAPTPLYAPVPPYNNWTIAVAADGLTGVIHSDRAAANSLFVVTRANVLGAFSAGTAALALNTSSGEASPRFSRDGATFYFDSARLGSRDLFRASAGSGGFGSPEPITELNDPIALEASAVLSADELTIYFGSTRALPPDDAQPPVLDIYKAVRSSRSMPFSVPIAVPGLNSAGNDAPSGISPDGCTLYLWSDRGGAGNIDNYIARRPN